MIHYHVYSTCISEPVIWNARQIRELHVVIPSHQESNDAKLYSWPVVVLLVTVESLGHDMLSYSYTDLVSCVGSDRRADTDTQFSCLIHLTWFKNTKTVVFVRIRRKRNSICHADTTLPDANSQWKLDKFSPKKRGTLNITTVARSKCDGDFDLLGVFTHDVHCISLAWWQTMTSPPHD